MVVNGGRVAAVLAVIAGRGRWSGVEALLGEVGGIELLDCLEGHSETGTALGGAMCVEVDQTIIVVRPELSVLFTRQPHHYTFS